jgi:hypothetical protein
MSNDAQALAPEPVSEDDYQAFHAVLAATARGRAFLDEHARRHRHADTEMLLTALKRLENQVAAQVPQAVAPVAPKTALGEIGAVLDTVRSARAEIDAVRLAGAVTQLVSALDSVQRKLSALVAPAPSSLRAADPPPVKAPFSLAITAVAAQALAKAGPEEEPVKVFKAGEIPPPPPVTGDDFASGAELTAPEANAPQENEREAQDAEEARKAQIADDVTNAGGERASPASEPTLSSPVATTAEAAAAFDAIDDALAPVMALSEEERLALFT